MQVPAPFEYERATSVDHAIALMERLGSEARVVAGGHSLLPMMKLRLATPEYLIDINDLSQELEYIRIAGSEVRIGALTRHRQLLESDELADVFPIFRDAEKVIADPVVRNRGTLGGSLCQADPSEDLSAVCDALSAECVIRNSSGDRVVSMHDFHRGPYETAVADGEMLTEIRIPIRPNSSSAYHKVERRAGDWAVASAGAAVTMDGPGPDAVIADGRVGFYTSSGSGKAKRLAHTSKVIVQPSDARGRPKAGTQPIEATAEGVTGAALADDLGRFLSGEPALARRPSLVDRAAKWARRHQSLVAMAAICASSTDIGWPIRRERAGVSA